MYGRKTGNISIEIILDTQIKTDSSDTDSGPVGFGINTIPLDCSRLFKRVSQRCPLAKRGLLDSLIGEKTN